MKQYDLMYDEFLGKGDIKYAEASITFENIPWPDMKHIKVMLRDKNIIEDPITVIVSDPWLGLSNTSELIKLVEDDLAIENIRETWWVLYKIPTDEEIKALGPTSQTFIYTQN